MTGLTEVWRRKLAYLRKIDPEGYQEAIEVLFEFERRQQRAEYEASFLAFVKRAWQEVDPATPADRGPEDRSRPVFSETSSGS